MPSVMPARASTSSTCCMAGWRPSVLNGSAVLALCYVAAGRYDAWLEVFIGRWDFSAAALMVQEAGGQVTDFYGSPSFLEGHHIVATNGALHGPLLEILLQALPAGM